MKKNRLEIAWPLAAFFLGGLFGLLVGAGYSGSMTKSYILDNNAGWLSLHINRLAMLRNKNIDGCIRSIERDLDNCVLQIAGATKNRHGQFDFSRLPETHLRALQVAGVYFDAGFEAPFSEESVEMLSLIDPLEKKYCPQDLQSLQEQASQQKEDRQ
jgi:hypothetical protein